jgi:integrase
MRTNSTSQRRKLYNRERYPGLYVAKSGRFEFPVRDHDGALRWIGCTVNGANIDKVSDAYRFMQRYKGLEKTAWVLPTSITFKQLAAITFDPDTYLDSVGTLTHHISRNKVWLKPLWRMKPSEITKDDLVRLVITPMRQAGKSSAYIHGVKGTASLVFQKGMSATPRIVWANPAAELVAGKDIPAWRTEKTHVILTPEQVGQLFAYADDDHPNRQAWALMVFAGLRVSEALGLDWQDVDFVKNRLFVHQQLDFKGTGERVSLKTKASTGYVDMAGVLRKVLLEEHIRQGRPQEGYVVSFDGGKTHISTHTVRMGLQRAEQKLGLPDASPHDLRHTFASAALTAAKSKLDIARVSRQLRHRDITVTLKTYAHVFGEEQDGTTGAVIDDIFAAAMA